MEFKIDRAVIEVNGGCNYTCQMCPQTNKDGTHGARGKDWLKKMSLEDFECYVAECAEHGLNVVNLEGSGEPTLANNLPEYISIVKKYNAKAFMFTNGWKMKGNYMKECVDAGLDFCRFSIIGYDYPTYKQWMNSENFYDVCVNVKHMNYYIEDIGSDCVVGSYHLITDNNQVENQLNQYKSLVKQIGSKAEIWKMHNWAGVFDIGDNKRSGVQKTCGRPFSPDIVIRAGGLDGMRGAVHPCCQVLGRDDEAVLGHLSEQSIEDVWFGREYEHLREAHRKGEYPKYCLECDFLIDDPEVLVWTNHERDLYKMHGTKFDLNDYRK